MFNLPSLSIAAGPLGGMRFYPCLGLRPSGLTAAHSVSAEACPSIVTPPVLPLSPCGRGRRRTLVRRRVRGPRAERAKKLRPRNNPPLPPLPPPDRSPHPPP